MPSRCRIITVFVDLLILAAIAPSAIAIRKVATAAESNLSSPFPSISTKNLRRLEDSANDGDNDGSSTDDDFLYGETIMSIEKEVETALIDMFYSAPSEWTTRHWAFFGGMMAILFMVLCWCCTCAIPLCCGCSGQTDTKPLVVRTEEEHNHYTNELMTDDDKVEKQAPTDVNSRHETFEDESASDYTGSYATSSSSSSAEAFQDEYQESDGEAYEYTNSHGNYYKYKGRHRRQLT